MSGSQEVTYAVDFRACKPSHRQRPGGAMTCNPIPRIVRLMALAIRFDALLRENKIQDYAELARRRTQTEMRRELEFRIAVTLMPRNPARRSVEIDGNPHLERAASRRICKCRVSQLSTAGLHRFSSRSSRLAMFLIMPAPRGSSVPARPLRRHCGRLGFR